MFKAVLFDFDGTLVNSLPFYIKASDLVLKKFGHTFSDKDFVKKCFGKTEEIDSHGQSPWYPQGLRS